MLKELKDIPGPEHSCICGAEKGQLHKLYCEYEECPFCRTQLMSCDCAGILLEIPKGRDFTTVEERKWREMLKKKGRIPEGSEVHYKAPEIWTREECQKLIATICEEMYEESLRGSDIPAGRVEKWADRIRSLNEGNPVFLEMNRLAILEGRPLTWFPPQRPKQKEKA